MAEKPSKKALDANKVLLVGLDAAKAAFEAVVGRFPEIVVIPEGTTISLKITAPGAKQTPVYSGEDSKDLWDRVNALKDPILHDAAYGMGCTLKNMEEQFLNYLEQAEREESQ